MKKLVLTAFTASLVFSGWQASALTTSTIQAATGASVQRAGDDSGDNTTAKKDKKVKKDKKNKKADKDKKTTKDKKGKKPKKGKAEELPESAMAQYLKDVTFFNAQPDLNAKYFIYLQSASWCGPCNMEMPHIVEEYKKMKEDGRVEIILVGHDKTEDKAKGFLTQYKAEFPGILVTDQKALSLPSFAKAAGIPNAIIVDADGAVLYKGHPGPLFSRKQWKVYTIDKAN